MLHANSNTIVGQNIKNLREKMGITQEVLAEYLGTSRETISYYETGTRSVPVDALTKMANLFCIDEYDFYEEDSQAQTLNLAFAFRASELVNNDLESIASFKRIVKNYEGMKKLLSNA